MASAFGYVVFTRPRDAANTARYESFCNAFLATVLTDTSYPDIPASAKLPTYWLSTTAKKFGVGCPRLVRDYAYGRAQEIAVVVGYAGATGPMLIATDQPLLREAASHNLARPDYALMVDLSHLPDAELQRGVNRWVNYIGSAKRPSDFHIALDSFREEFRTLIQQYGDQVVAIIRPASKQ